LEDSKEKYIKGEKEILIEDESGRMTLIGEKIQSLDVITGKFYQKEKNYKLLLLLWFFILL